MRIPFKNWLASIFLLLLLAVAVSAQTSFIQITDPHIFDADQQLKADEPLTVGQMQKRRLDSEEAFVGALKTINQLIATGARYEFIVITGDLGLAHSNRSIPEAAKKMAEWIGESKVTYFLFIPGNND